MLEKISVLRYFLVLGILQIIIVSREINQSTC